ncbi:MAG TPA: 16S rRNA (adenine(1518)-N(6)/adenine(1519)-N(6))-dimethyltransferase RsmA [Candidatus Acidoferrum sp.]|nr:16S rRNA (adenine(1518)-N(6)/adenine(1519)-N(6))-dimethyltransferase RsmA [Candidatus Acidoferrum sp.]
MSPTRLGQNFLADANWRARIAALLGVRAGDAWVEIGAGHGEMTELLAKSGVRVTAIELDAGLASQLRKRAIGWPGVKVVEADVLDVDLAKLSAASPFRIYGNIPYYITSPILHRIFDVSTNHSGSLLSAHLVMQLEVAERITAHPGRREYGYLSAATQFHSKPEILLRIPRGAFKPRPKVVSALVQLSFPGECANLDVANADAFLKFVQGCFAQKRKTLANNLRAIRSARPTDKNHTAGPPATRKLAEIMDEAGIEAGARAEQLNVGQFAALFRAMASS